VIVMNGRFDAHRARSRVEAALAGGARVGFLSLALVLLGLPAVSLGQARLTASPQAASAQAAAANEQYIDQLHQFYLKRRANDDELEYWLDELDRGLPFDEVHAGVVASEAFYLRCQSNAERFVESALRLAFSHDPSQSQFDYWSDRLEQLRGDRMRWSLELIDSINPSESKRPVDQRQSGHLASMTNLLVQSIRAEASGRTGYLARAQAENLRESIAYFAPTLESPTADRKVLQEALDDVQSAVGGVEQTLARTHVNAPDSRYYLGQIKESLELARSRGQAAYQPTYGAYDDAPQGLARDAYQKLQDYAEDLSRRTRTTVETVRGTMVRNATYDQELLLRSLQDLQQEIDGLASHLRYHQRPDELGPMLERVYSFAKVAIDQHNRVMKSTPSNFVYRDLRDAVVSFDQLMQFADTLPPNYRPQVREPAMQSNQQISALASGASAAIAQSDALAMALGPLAFASPQVQQIQGENRLLRNTIDQIRQQAAAGYDVNTLKATAASLTQQLNRFQQAFNGAFPAGGRLRPPSPAGFIDSIDGILQVLR
jgi:hypothetical protein